MDGQLNCYFGVSEVLFFLDVGEELSIALIFIEDQQFRSHLASLHPFDSYREAGSLVEVVDLIDALNDYLGFLNLAEKQGRVEPFYIKRWIPKTI